MVDGLQVRNPKQGKRLTGYLRPVRKLNWQRLHQHRMHEIDLYLPIERIAASTCGIANAYSQYPARRQG